MNLGISKLGSRKAMRVATVFTGVTACAAAFAPAANAQTDGELAPPLALRPTAGQSTRFGSNCSNAPHWFHLYFKSSLTGDLTSRCIGGTGSWYFAAGGQGFPMSGFCGGNNVGYFSGWFGGRRLTDQRFHQSSSVYWWPGNHSSVISYLYISKWGGNKTCPTLK
jgi:hypothetical protein